MNELISKLPSPYEILTDPITIWVYVIFGSLYLWESLFPARKLPNMHYWQLRGLAFFFIFILFTTYIPIIWDDFFASYQLINMSQQHILTQSVIGIFLFELIQYGWHLSMHKSDFLFRISHQIHHSAERLDVSSAFMFSINDMIGLSLVGSLSFALILGISPQAITIIILTTTFLGIFQHANINTPHWIGYLVQRPESHTIHHARGIHAYNYTDLACIDILFGTFKNPKKHEHETGYYHGASNKVLDMLKGKDITKRNSHV